MNRPIKFRAWDGRKMITDMGVFGATLNRGIEMHAEQGNTLMQFTGLLDKDGKEIYEGDIVQVFYHNRSQTDENKAYTVVIEDMRNSFVGVGEKKGEVIGNIYENPELLNHD